MFVPWMVLGTLQSMARRHLRPDRLAALDVPDGSDGRPVTLDDSRNIDPEDVLGPDCPTTFGIPTCW